MWLRCWGGNYPPNIDSLLESPAFTVPEAGLNPRLRFWHWYSFGLFDRGILRMRVVGSNWVDLATYSSYSGNSWLYPAIDLKDFAGQRVQLGFLLHSENYGYGGDEAPGWYIDDIQIRAGPEIFDNPESFEFSWGDWDTDNYALWQIGTPVSGPPVNSSGLRAFSYTNCAATVLGGNYPANSSGRLITPSLTVPALNPGDLSVLRFWQWYQYGAGDAGLVPKTFLGSLLRRRVSGRISKRI